MLLTGVIVIRCLAGLIFVTDIGCTAWVAVHPNVYVEALYVVLAVCLLVGVMLLRKIRYDILSSMAQTQHAPIHAMYIPVPSSSTCVTATTESMDDGSVPPASAAPGVVAITFPIGPQTL